MSDRAGGPTADVLVVGGGPAGLSAALNLARARSSVAAVLVQDALGVRTSH